MRGGHYLPALDIIDREKWKAHIVKWADEADLKKVGDDDMGLKARERYARFEVAADEAAAYQALEACVRKMRLTFEAHTWGEPIDDRIWLPDHPVLMMAAGEIPHERNQLWPRHYVSYAGFSDYAAWVREKSDTRLRVWLYSFADAEESGFVRFWRAPLGEYEVLFGPDADGDGAPDAATPTRHTLHRSAVLPVRLPPRRLCALHINLVRKSDEDFWKRPDLAVSADDAARAGGGVSVVVHNVGGGPARAAVVRLLDAAGRRLDEKTVPVLEAPLDLVPRTVKVEFAGVPAQGPLAVVLDPDNAIPELNELNNSVRLER
jgi:hypothetical protein